MGPVLLRIAQLPKFDRGLWHPYRRAWASSRKHLPDVDVSRAGGWRDLATMKASYRQADPETMLRAIENAPGSHQTGTASQRTSDGTTTWSAAQISQFDSTTPCSGRDSGWPASVMRRSVQRTRAPIAMSRR